MNLRLMRRVADIAIGQTGYPGDRRPWSCFLHQTGWGNQSGETCQSASWSSFFHAGVAGAENGPVWANAHLTAAWQKRSEKRLRFGHRAGAGLAGWFDNQSL